MRKTRAQYHAAIRKARKDEANIVNDRFALALSNNCNRNFCKEVKRIRGRTSNVSSVVDGQSSSADIANMFGSKYSDLYSCVSYDIEDMELIRSELNTSVKNDGYDGASAVNENDIMSTIRKLKSGKRDGSLGLCTDHFINACSELAAHVALLFSAMLLHGIASGDMYSCTLIRIPKGKNVNISD